MATIILAEDHIMVRQGLRRIIEDDPDLQVIREADDGVELLKLLEDNTPDMVILDISMPHLEGLETAKIIKKKYPRIKILILTMHKDRHYLSEAQEIGIHGYLLKEEADTVLNSAIKTILQGNSYVSPLLGNS